MVNPYDKSARYAAKMDPAGFCHWLLHEPSGLVFREWLDTRTIPFPGERDRICDTVARLDREVRKAEPVACIVEFQSRREPEILERLAEYAIRVRRETRHGRGRRGRFTVIAALVNLTGRPQTNSLRMSLPEVPVAELSFRVVIRTLSQEDAGVTLDGIHSGDVARSILPWVSLMAGGGEDGIINRWKRLAQQEPNIQRRSDFAALSLVFAELAGCADAWKRGLEGWNMIQSKQIQEWQDEARVQTRLETTRQTLLRALELRFPGALPRKFVKRLEASDDLEELNHWFDAALTAADWETFANTINGAG